MVKEIESLMSGSGVVEVKRVLHFGSLNNVMMSVFGKCYDFSEKMGDGFELEGLVSEGDLVGRVNVFVGKIIEEHRAENGGAMGLATVHLWLAQLLQSFEWVAAGGGGGGVDLSEVLNLNLSMEMKNPLVCKAVARAF
ncbi:hypothetical protein C3L33_14205, partial [Rhododendron williamsianum]